MRRGVIKVTVGLSTVSFPEGTKLLKIRQLFDEDGLELLVEHPTLHELPQGVAAPRVVLYNCSDGRAWFE